MINSIIKVGIILLIMLMPKWVCGAAYEHVQQIGALGSGQGHFFELRHIAAVGGDIFVVDSGNNRIVKLDSNLTWKYSFGEIDPKSDGLSRPTGICVDTQRMLWVTDSGNNRLKVFSADGTAKRQIGEFGISELSFNGPTGIACDSFGTIYVCDSGNDRVVVMDTEAQFRFDFGQTGHWNERLVHPTALVILGDSHVLIADRSANPLKIFDRFGNFLQGVPISDSLGTVNVTAMAGVGQDRIWIADDLGNRVVQLNREGEVLAVIDQSVHSPNGLTLVGSDLVVSNGQSGTINRYRLSTLRRY